MATHGMVFMFQDGDSWHCLYIQDGDPLYCLYVLRWRLMAWSLCYKMATHGIVLMFQDVDAWYDLCSKSSWHGLCIRRRQGLVSLLVFPSTLMLGLGFKMKKKSTRLSNT